MERKTFAKQSEQNGDGGGGRTRTYEGVSQRIYSRLHIVKYQWLVENVFRLCSV